MVQTETLTEFEVYSYNPFILDESAKRGVVYHVPFNEHFFPNKIQNLYGYGIRVSIHPRPPFSVLKNSNELESGIEVEILRSMASVFNFTPVLVTSQQNAYDYVVQLENGTEKGPIGNLLINK